MCYLGLHKKKREDSRVLAIESLASGKEDREIQRRKTEKTKEKIQARAHRDREREREREREGKRIWRLFLSECVVCGVSTEKVMKKQLREVTLKGKKKCLGFSVFFFVSPSRPGRRQQEAPSHKQFFWCSVLRIISSFFHYLFILAFERAERRTKESERRRRLCRLFFVLLSLCVWVVFWSRAVCVCVCSFFSSSSFFYRV